MSKKMLILRQPAGTNFKLAPTEESRLQKMWFRAGQLWSRDESILGLWAYNETYNTKASQPPEPITTLVSDLTGRTIDSVHKKILNFRNIDPRNQNEGASEIEPTDLVVWKNFFDTKTQTLNNLKEEFSRILGTTMKISSGAFMDEPTEPEVFFPK